MHVIKERPRERHRESVCVCVSMCACIYTEKETRECMLLKCSRPVEPSIKISMRYARSGMKSVCVNPAPCGPTCVCVCVFVCV